MNIGTGFKASIRPGGRRKRGK